MQSSHFTDMSQPLESEIPSALYVWGAECVTDTDTVRNYYVCSTIWHAIQGETPALIYIITWTSRPL